jgi:hypothetical protein
MGPWPAGRRFPKCSPEVAILVGPRRRDLDGRSTVVVGRSSAGGPSTQPEDPMTSLFKLLFKRVIQANANDYAVVCATRSEDGDANLSITAPTDNEVVIFDCEGVKEIYRAISDAYPLMVKAEAEAGTLSYQAKGSG